MARAAAATKLSAPPEAVRALVAPEVAPRQKLEMRCGRVSRAAQLSSSFYSAEPLSLLREESLPADPLSLLRD